MATPQDYILSFDLQSFTSQFSILQRSYTDFGETLHKMSSQVSADLKGIQEQAGALFQTLSSLGMVSETGFSSFERHLKQTSTYLDDYQKKSSEISQRLKDISSTDISKISGAVGAMAAPEDKLADIGDKGTAVGETDVKKESEDVNKKLEEFEKKIGALEENIKKKMEEFFKNIWGVIEKEGKQAKAKAGSIFSELTGGMLAGGGMVGMALGFMLLGKKEEYRKSAEAGEMLNVFEAGTAGTQEKAQKEAVKWASGFQEKAAKLYGIGREETQAVVKSMIDAGYEVTSKLGQFDNKLGEVGTNVMTTTLGLDKLYNMATGTSATNVNKLVADYGDKLSDATKKYVELSFAAQRSGMGVEKFVNSVMAGSQALSQYGIEMTDIKDVMQQLHKYYKDMGLSDQAAGAQAARSLQGVTAGVGSGGALAMLAKEMHPDLGAIEAMQKVEQGAQRIAAGEDIGYFKDLMKAKVKIASNMSRGDKVLGIEFLKGAGYFPDTQSASAAWDLVMSGKIDSREGVDQAEVGKQMHALKDAFITEGQQLSLLQKQQYNLMQGLATVGQGLIKILSGILGALVTGFYWLYSLPSRLSMEPAEREKADEAFKAAWEAQKESFSSGLGDVWEGGGKAKDALGSIFGDMFKSMVPAVDLIKSGVGGNVDKLMQEVAELAVKQEAQDRVIITLLDDLSSLSPAIREGLSGVRTLMAADYAMQTAKGTTTKRKSAAAKVVKGEVRRRAAMDKAKRESVVGLVSGEKAEAMRAMYEGRRASSSANGR
jgi:hypothetical protein